MQKINPLDDYRGVINLQFSDRHYYLKITYRKYIRLIRGVEQFEDIFKCERQGAPVRFENQKEFLVFLDKIQMSTFSQKSKGDVKEIPYDHIADFDVIYSEFLNLNHSIDLMVEDIDFLKYSLLLNKILSEKNSLTNRIDARMTNISKLPKEKRQEARERKLAYKINKSHRIF